LLSSAEAEASMFLVLDEQVMIDERVRIDERA